MDDSDFMVVLILGLIFFGRWLVVFLASDRHSRRQRADLFRLPPRSSFPEGITVRPYQTADESACLAIYESNTEFVPPMPELLSESIDEHPDGFFVAEIDGKIVACGGIVLAPEKTYGLLWMGLVHRNRHRQKIGTLMMLVRLALIEDLLTVVTLETTSKTEPFYKSFGFQRYSQPEKRYLGEHSHFYMRCFIPKDQGKPIRAYLRKTNVVFAFDFDSFDFPRLPE